MKNGQVYINIHTQRNPKEEIRGQIIWSVAVTTP
jgi:hypothetical protein